MIKFYFTILFLSSLSFAHGGNGVSNGLENKNGSLSGKAWFIDYNRYVHFCLKISPDFGMSESEAAPLVIETFKTWAAYVHLSAGSLYHRVLARSIKYDEECTPKTDLEFYLGATPPQALTAQLLHHDGAIAWAQPTEYKKTEHWAKGFIWIASPKEILMKATHIKDFIWTPLKFKAASLHEWGHVFGVEDHVPGTIMQERLAELIQNMPNKDSGPDNGDMENIDWDRQLVEFPTEMTMSDKLTGPPSEAFQSLYLKYFGIQLVGDLHIVADFSGPLEAFFNYTYQVQILDKAPAQNRFLLKNLNRISVDKGTCRIFSVYLWDPNHEDFSDLSLCSPQYHFTADFVHMSTGKSVPVYFLANREGGYRILTANDQKEVLFWGFPSSWR